MEHKYAWKPVALMEGIEEVWVTFHCAQLDKEVSIEVCSVEDLIFEKIGDQDDVRQRIQEAIEEMEA
tara:strand:+ start:327 stop:527 length:201 start_codon:yes stop_codon:yes gene_type:complete